MIKIYWTETKIDPIGSIQTGTADNHLVCVAINKSVEDILNEKIPAAEFVRDDKANEQIIEEFKEYFSEKRKTFSIQYKFLFGTEFQKKVWNALVEIPYGKTISYTELASRTGNNNAQRAVGNANSKNPIPIIIPCHRVIAANGNLGGFSCGLNIKKHLLKLENPNIKFL